MKNRLTVTIAGNVYSLVADESPEYMQKIAEYVNARLDDIVKQGGVTLLDAALLCAANLCDETFKTRENAENMRAQLKAYVADASRAKLELAELRRELARLQDELADKTEESLL